MLSPSDVRERMDRDVIASDIEARIDAALNAAVVAEKWPATCPVVDDPISIVEEVIARYRGAGWTITLVRPMGAIRESIRIEAP